jgi:hypothetical protein
MKVPAEKIVQGRYYPSVGLTFQLVLHLLIGKIGSGYAEELSGKSLSKSASARYPQT